MMKTKTIFVFLLVSVLAVFGSAQAGDLEPGAPPGSTMHTLDEIYDKLDECTGGGSYGVPKTGQTKCYDGYIVISCAGTGQDAEYQMGVSASPRFTDNGDGTVTDNLTGLIWLQDASCFYGPWTTALSDANTLADGSCGLTDGSVVGDWRLPNVKELQTLVDYGQYNPAFPSEHPFSGELEDIFWSSTSRVDAPDSAWIVEFVNGIAHIVGKGYGFVVWPVRGGK